MDLSTQAGKEILNDIARNTSSVRGWRNLMLLCFDQKDIDTFKTLQIICEGLDKLFERKKIEARQEFETAVKAIRESKLKVHQQRLPNPIVTSVPLTDAQRQAFLKLARTPNNSSLLEKVSLYYLEDWGLPNVAQKHLERALNFEPEDKQVIDTLAKAAEALTHAATITALQMPKVDSTSTTELSRSVLSQTVKLKIPSVLRKASSPLPAERSQALLGHHIEQLNDKHAFRKRDAGFKTANLSAIHNQLMSLQSKIEVIEQRAQSRLHPSPPVKPVDNKVTAQRSSPPIPMTSAELLSKSLADVHEGNLDEAAASCRRALELNPDQPLVWHTWATIGMGFFERRELEKSISAFNEALRLEPNAVESWFNMGVSYSAKGDIEGALRCYLRSLFLAPGNPKVRCNLGAVYFQNNQFEHAEQCFRAAIELDHGYARAWDNLGATLSALNKLPEAEKACRKATELKPDYPDAWFKLGTILYQLEEYPKAREAFEKTRQLRPDFAASYVYLAMLDARDGKLEEAESCCKRFTILGGVPGLDWLGWQEYAMASLKQNHIKEAIAACRRATDLQPNEPEPWFALGMSLHQAGEIHEAESAYKECLKMRLDMPYASYNLGIILLEQQKFPEAVAALEAATIDLPTSAQAWFYLGRSREALQQTEPALSAYGRAVELDPKMVEAWQNLSALLEESGRHDEAIQHQQKALAALEN